MLREVQDNIIMLQYAPKFFVVCVLLCSSFNYTFPLHRVKKEWPSAEPGLNCTEKCRSADRHGTADRSKKMTSTKPTKNLQSTVNSETSGKHALNEDDLRQYEQLVIMKKYPYLDLKEFELKYHQGREASSGKNIRQNAEYAPEAGLFIGDLGNCESIEEAPNVEIMNRGLSGFAIPQLSKPVGVADKLKTTDTKLADAEDVKLTKKSSHTLVSLRDDIREFAAKKNGEEVGQSE